MLARAIRYRRKAFLLRLARRLGGESLLLWLARCFYRLRLEGVENIPAQGACVLAFNHVSNIADALVYLALRTRRPDVHLFTWRLVGNEIAGLLDAFWQPENTPQLLFAYRRQGLSVTELLRARQVLLQGGAVALAPEGEITWDGRLQQPLAPGAAWMALRTACPIVPVVSLGGYDVQPLWQMEKIRLTGRITIRAGQPLQVCETPLEAVSQPALKAASEQLAQAMLALLAFDHR